MSNEKKPFEGWVILELMGHRRLGGLLSQVEVGGAAFLRIDIPSEHADAPSVAQCVSEAGESPRSPRPWAATQFYAPSAVYCITPTTEELASQVAATNRPAPVQRWELPALPKASADDGYDNDDDPV